MPRPSRALCERAGFDFVLLTPFGPALRASRVGPRTLPAAKRRKIAAHKPWVEKSKMDKPWKGRKKSYDTDSEGQSIIFGDSGNVPSGPGFAAPDFTARTNPVIPTGAGAPSTAQRRNLLFSDRSSRHKLWDDTNSRADGKFPVVLMRYSVPISGRNCIPPSKKKKKSLEDVTHSSVAEEKAEGNFALK
jgi:hypothetical protein